MLTKSRPTGRLGMLGNATVGRANLPAAAQQRDQSIGDRDEFFIAAVTGMCRLGGLRLYPWRALMSTGTVKWFNPTKGYGFIQPQGGGQDVFVHISAVEKAGLSTLNEGQQVEFDIVSNRGKSSAENLKVK
jgi:CspA family cold shock protein